MKIKKYFEFVLENKKNKLTVPLQFSFRFLKLLGNSKRGIISPIKDALLELELTPQDLSLVDIGDDSDKATFTSAQKLANHFNTQNQKELNTLVKPLRDSNTTIYNINRTEIRIGRLIKKLFGDRFNDKQIEDFVNQYKSILDRTSLSFELWYGSDITRGYVSSNYVYSGDSSNSLRNSCMNDCVDWVDFYMGCPVQLLVLLNDDGEIYGRSLIWKIKDNQYIMDRVYVAFESDYFKFVKYAKSNGWWWKAENKSGSSIPYTNGIVTDWFPIEVKLKFDFEDYKDWEVPYLDTFSYCQGDKLTNYIPKGEYYLLTSTDGTYDVQRN